MSVSPLEFGVVTGQHHYTWEGLASAWQFAEDAGFDSAWIFDHFMALYGDPTGDCLEATALLAALAVKTSRIKIGSLVYSVTHRHPSVFAKEMATIDRISGGRLILGIGTGWNEREHEAYGIRFPSAADRVEMLDEALQIFQSFFTQERTSFEGEHFTLVEAPFSPKPVQPHLPILVGAERPRMLKLVARHADLWDSARSPERLREGVEQLALNCQEIGRDPAEIRVSVSLGADSFDDLNRFERVVRDYRSAGASQLLFDLPLENPGLANARKAAQEIIPRLKAELV